MPSYRSQVVVLIIHICSFFSSLRAVPTAKWPKEWSAFTNITRAEYPEDDVGYQFYSAAHNAQIVSHSNIFNTSEPAVALWVNDKFYEITDNYNSCCLESEFDFPMPNPNWVDLLRYTGNDTIIGVDCYLFQDPKLISTKYWMSIDGELPVAWSNVPDEYESPIVQYFMNVVVNIDETALAAELFVVPEACGGPDVPICTNRDNV